MPAANHKTPLVSIEISDECNFSLFASNNTNNTDPTDLRWTIADVDGDSLHHGYLSSALRHTAILAFPSHSVCCLCMAFQQCFARSFRLSSPCVHRTIISPICLILLPPSPASPPPLSSHPFPFSPFQHFGSLADLVMSQYSKVQTPTITELSEANHTCPSSISVLRAHHAHRPQLHCPLHQLLHYI